MSSFKERLKFFQEGNTPSKGPKGISRRRPKPSSKKTWNPNGTKSVPAAKDSGALQLPGALPGRTLAATAMGLSAPPMPGRKPPSRETKCDRAQGRDDVTSRMIENVPKNFGMSTKEILDRGVKEARKTLYAKPPRRLPRRNKPSSEKPGNRVDSKISPRNSSVDSITQKMDHDKDYFGGISRRALADLPMNQNSASREASEVSLDDDSASPSSEPQQAKSMTGGPPPAPRRKTAPSVEKMPLASAAPLPPPAPRRRSAAQELHPPVEKTESPAASNVPTRVGPPPAPRRVGPPPAPRRRGSTKTPTIAKVTVAVEEEEEEEREEEEGEGEMDLKDNEGTAFVKELPKPVAAPPPPPPRRNTGDATVQAKKGPTRTPDADATGPAKKPPPPMPASGPPPGRPKLKITRTNPVPPAASHPAVVENKKQPPSRPKPPSARPGAEPVSHTSPTKPNAQPAGPPPRRPRPPPVAKEGMASSPTITVASAPGVGSQLSMFARQANSVRELSVSVGDVLIDVEDVDQHWFRATRRGAPDARGLVPKNYVATVVKIATVRHSYAPQQGVQHGLRLTKGETVLVTTDHNTGWCSGFQGKAYGVFPSNHVHESSGTVAPASGIHTAAAAKDISREGLHARERSNTLPNRAAAKSDSHLEKHVALDEAKRRASLSDLRAPQRLPRHRGLSAGQRAERKYDKMQCMILCDKVRRLLQLTGLGQLKQPDLRHFFAHTASMPSTALDSERIFKEIDVEAKGFLTAKQLSTWLRKKKIKAENLEQVVNVLEAQSKQAKQADKDAQKSSVHVVSHDYTADDGAEGVLTLCSGTSVCVLDSTRADWWLIKVTSTNQQGYFPKRYLRKTNGDADLKTAEMIHKYDAVARGQLSVAAGEKVSLIGRDENGWCFCRSESGKEGYVPTSYMKRL